MHREFVAIAGAHPQRQPAGFGRYLLHANALPEPSTPLVQLDDQAVQHRHRIELRLIA
jgi:hypothetical protein